MAARLDGSIGELHHELDVVLAPEARRHGAEAREGFECLIDDFRIRGIVEGEQIFDDIEARLVEGRDAYDAELLEALEGFALGRERLIETEWGRVEAAGRLPAGRAGSAANSPA